MVQGSLLVLKGDLEMLKGKRILSEKDVQYHIVPAGTGFDTGVDGKISIIFKGRLFPASMSPKNRGRISGIAELFNTFPDDFAPGKELYLEYDETKNLIRIESKSNGNSAESLPGTFYSSTQDETQPEDDTDMDDYSDEDNVAFLREGRLIQSCLYEMRNFHGERLYAIIREYDKPKGKVYNFATENSPQPVYFWSSDEPVVHYYTEADRIVLNPDSSHMFEWLDKLIEIDTYDWDISQVRNASYMFNQCKSLKGLDIGGEWRMENMLAMFYNCNSIESLGGEVIINLKNTTMASHLFDKCHNLADSITLKNLNVGLFDRDPDVFYGMFSECYCLSYIYVEDTRIGDTGRFEKMLDKWFIHDYVKEAELNIDDDNMIGFNSHLHLSVNG